MVQKKEMKKINWLVTISGVLITLVGYGLVSPITRNYETAYAFFAILTLNIGLLTVLLGLSVSFDFLYKKGK